jgi:hypothetical protein
MRSLGHASIRALAGFRPCEGAESAGEDCSGISQAPYAFTDVLARF